MKKLNLLLMLLMCFLACQSYYAQAFIMPTCSSHVDSYSWGSPLRTTTVANDKTRTAFIIPASQLSTISNGVLTSTYFYRYTPTGTINGTATMKIYLKNTTETTYATAPTWSTEISSATMVYDGNPQSIVGSTAGYKEFPHSTNFTYTSGSNLAVFVEYVQTAAQASNIYWSYEYTTPCVVTSTNNSGRYESTTSAFTTTLPTANYRRPFLGFNVNLPPASVLPSCTTVSSPANAATGVAVAPTITWATAPNAHNYFVNLGTTSGGTDVLNNFNAGLQTSYTVPSTSALNYNTTYYVTVTPSNNIGTASGCTESSFSTVAIPCPSVSQPAAAATGTSLKPTISWSSVSGVTGYRLSVGTTSGGTDVLNNLDVGNVLTYTFLSNLNPSTQYFYTIVAYQGANTSASCTIRNFTTGTAVPPSNDECSSAVSLTVNPALTCTATTAGNTLGATMSMAAAPCFGTPNDDVWYSFVATSPSHILSLTNVVSTGTSSATDMYFQILSGTCGAMTSVLCSDPDSNIVNGLTPGATYYVRVYTYSANSNAFASFNICVLTPPAAPANDNCADAVTLTVNPDMNCGSLTSGTTLGGTPSGVAVGACTGTADDDVFYKFTATSTIHTYQVKNVVSVGTSSSTSLYSQIFNGVCGSLTSTTCVTSNSNYTVLSGLTVGQTYYVRVYNSESNSGATLYANTFDICIGTLPAAPANDDCVTPVNLTVNGTLTCASPTSGTTFGATNSSIAVGTCTGTPDDDVWYTFTAVGTDHTVLLSNVTSVGSSSSTSLNTQVFSGACGTLTSVKCGTTNTTVLNGLTPGTLYYVRVYNTNANTATALYANTFNICIGTPPPPPANDSCSGAVSLSVSNNDTFVGLVSGSTVSATPSTGVTAPTCSATGVNDDVWYSFAATATTHLLHVLYSDNATTTQVYSGACGSLTAVSCFDGAFGNSSMLLNALSVGTTYYVRVFSTTSTATTTSNFQIAVTTPSVPANDTCATATALACNGSAQGSNALATDDTLPTSTCGSSGSTASYKGVWFTVTATENGPITIDACGTQYDSYLRVYTGSCGALTCVSNTDGVGYADTGCTSNVYNASKLTFTGVSGTTYYVLLTGYIASRIGNYNVTVSQGCSNLSTAETASKKNNINVYPNPFADVLNISNIKDVKSIMISDMSGKIVKTISKPESTLRLGDLNAGMYLVILNMNDGSRQTIKAIKK